MTSPTAVQSASRDKPPLLVIAHHPGTRFRTRSLEIARSLARRRTVYYLDWEVAARPTQLARAAALLRGVGRRITVRREGELLLVSLPKILLVRQRGFVPRFNAWWLERVLRRFGIHHVLNANVMYFPLRRHPGGRLVFDFVDDLCHPDPGRERALLAIARRSAALADRISCCSEILREKIDRRLSLQSVFIPNGVHPFVRPPAEEHRALRERLGLGSGPVFVMAGRFGWWSGLELLEKAFDHLRQRRHMAAARLLLVGPGEALEELRRRRCRDPGFVFVGEVTPEQVPAYLDVADVGLLPSVVGDFRNHAFPIKVLEYAAARLPVVATPLQELVRLALPPVALVEEDPRVWSRALEAATQLEWEEGWDALLTPYHWERQARAFERLLFAPPQPHGPSQSSTSGDSRHRMRLAPRGNGTTW